MNKTDQGLDWSTVVSRALLFSIMWWALTDGAAGSWWIGVPAVTCAVIVSVALIPPSGIVWREVTGLVPFFLWHSLKGGMWRGGRFIRVCISRRNSSNTRSGCRRVCRR